MAAAFQPRAGIGGRLQEGLRHFLRARLGPQQRLVGERRHGGLPPLLELLLGEGGEVVLLQGGEERMLRMPGLHPHLARGGLLRVAPGPARRLHQQAEEALGRAEVAGKQRGIGIHGRHQRDAPEVVALGHHLRAHQHVDLARMHLRELLLQRALQPRAVGVHAGDARRRAVRPARVGQQFGQLFLQPLGAAPERRDVDVAALRAGARHAFGEAAVVAAQGAVDLVEHAVGAAVAALAAPVAGAAGEHRRVAAAVEEDQRLLAARDAFPDGRQQRRREQAALGLVVHVHQPHRGQAAGAHAGGHFQAAVAPALARLPALQRRRGGTQHHLGVFQPAPVHREVARRVARAFLLLVARVVLLVHDDQAQPRQRGEHRHAGAEHDARRAQVRGEPAAQALRMRHAAVQRHDGRGAEALDEARLQLRREVDLGHQHQRLRLRVAREQALHGLQVHLGLAAAGGAEQQEGTGLRVDVGERLGLVGGEFRGGGARRLRRGRRRALEATAELCGVQRTQLRRQGRERDLAETTLVVPGRESDELPPGGRQRRQFGQRGADRLELFRRRLVRPGGRVPHHAADLTAAQRYADQRSRRKWQLTAVAQRLAHRAVRGGRDDDMQQRAHPLLQLRCDA